MTQSHNIELFESIKSLLESQVQCVLATLDSTQPCLHLMAYAMNERLNEIYIASYSDTRKVRNMLAQPGVSLLWDNRTANHQDHVEGLALNATGEACLLKGGEHDMASDLLLSRNPSLDQLLASDNTMIFSVAVDSYTFVVGYNEVHEYTPVAL